MRRVLKNETVDEWKSEALKQGYVAMFENLKRSSSLRSLNGMDEQKIATLSEILKILRKTKVAPPR